MTQTKKTINELIDKYLFSEPEIVIYALRRMAVGSEQEVIDKMYPDRSKRMYLNRILKVFGFRKEKRGWQHYPRELHYNFENVIVEIPDRMIKIKFANKVSMTKIEYGKLIKLYPEPFIAKCIEKLNHYKERSGKPYSSDYRAILNWVVNAIKEEYPHLLKQRNQLS